MNWRAFFTPRLLRTRKTLRAGLWLLACGVLLVRLFGTGLPLVQGAHAAPRVHVLLAGVSDYSATPFPSLPGALNDMSRMQQLLQATFGVPDERLHVLINATATRSGVLDTLRRIEDEVLPQDSVYMHFSGHGSLTCDLNGDEPTGFDATLVTFGARTVPFGAELGQCPTPSALALVKEHLHAEAALRPFDDADLLDDELAHALLRLARRTPNIMVVIDACHSGSATRNEAGQWSRSVSMDRRLHPAGFMPPAPADAPRPWLAVGAAEDAARAVEHRAEDGQVYGALTWFWAMALQEAPQKATWGQVFARTCALLHEAGYSQKPQFQGEQATPLPFARILK